MRDDDELLSNPGLAFGSGIVGVCDICHKRQAVIILQKERFQVCVIDFLNKTFVNSKEKPGRPLPPYRSERIWFETQATANHRAPAIVLSPTKVAKHPIVLVTPDVYGLTTTLLDAGIRLAREGYEVLLPDVGKTGGIGAADHLSLRRGGLLGGGVALESARVRHLVALYRDGLRALRAREMVDPAKTAIVGFSYGASLAVALAAEDRQVSALALAYPMPVKPVDILKLITAPTLVVSAGHDRRGTTARTQFAAAAERNEIRAEFLDLPEVGANFLARDLSAYDLTNAEQAWARILTFVRLRLLPPPKSAPTPPKVAPPPLSTAPLTLKAATAPPAAPAVAPASPAAPAAPA
ncbi:MAG: dienelactone hydrolase family protein [Thermoplasmata archaeon]|nr:dienelactone hydrolase family protein [Thermoplasmata archaeon]